MTTSRPPGTITFTSLPIGTVYRSTLGSVWVKKSDTTAMHLDKNRKSAGTILRGNGLDVDAVLGRLPPHLVDTATEWRDEYRLPAEYDPERHDLWWVENHDLRQPGWYAQRPGEWEEFHGFTLVDPARPPDPLPPGTRFRFRTWPARWTASPPEEGLKQVFIAGSTNRLAAKNAFRVNEDANRFYGSLDVLPTDDIQILPDWRTPGTVFRFRTVPNRDWSPVEDLLDTTRAYVITGTTTTDGNSHFRRLPAGASRVHHKSGVAATDKVEILAHLPPQNVDHPFDGLEDLDPDWLTDAGRALVASTTTHEDGRDCSCPETITSDTIHVPDAPRRATYLGPAITEPTPEPLQKGAPISLVSRLMKFTSKTALWLTIGWLAFGGGTTVKDSIVNWWTAPTVLELGDWTRVRTCDHCRAVADESDGMCRKCGGEQLTDLKAQSVMIPNRAFHDKTEKIVGYTFPDGSTSPLPPGHWKLPARVVSGTGFLSPQSSERTIMIRTFESLLKEENTPSEIMDALAAAFEDNGHEDWAKLLDKAVDTMARREREARRSH